MICFGTFKVNIESDFNKIRAKEILQLLGFSTYYRGVLNKKQNDVIQLLQVFNNNLTAELEQEITTEGMLPSTITVLKQYAIALRDANIEQEKTKGTGPEISSENIAALNAIYNEVMRVIKVVKDIFKKDPVKKKYLCSVTVFQQKGRIYQNRNLLLKSKK